MLLGRLFANQMDLPVDAGPFDPRVLPGGGGVGALVTGDDRLIQLLAGQSLRRMLALRLDPRRQGASGKRAELAPVARRLWWRPTGSVFETDWVYLLVARQLLGPGYRKQLAIAKVWYACLRPADEHPHWVVSDAPFGAGVTAAGPFATRKRAAAFVADLEDLYDLCRYPEVLRQAPHGARCAYFDMGKCPAPCDGTVGLDHYRAALARSARFATQGAAERIVELHQEMARAAQALEFEHAQRCRDAVRRAEAVRKMEGRYALTPQELRLLIVQRVGKTRVFRPFFFNGGRLDVGCDAPAHALSAAATAWARRVASSDNPPEISADLRRDQTALVCHHLGKGDNAPGVYLNYAAASDAHAIIRRVDAVYGVRRASR